MTGFARFLPLFKCACSATFFFSSTKLSHLRKPQPYLVSGAGERTTPPDWLDQGLVKSVSTELTILISLLSD
ncbi:hypothetical protein L873DRAFT_361706 [Choiromyces venosus 120613-1]|uniref:Uncharacterized protein n=1 Tax=Choiromyces venosus 120613-1 TaxID=1336337 RepID=A0A3N4K059_9PEZI|nr:hypothetical protein L873DRAFT_361706 [Choiromyces venosus 120613-1]